MTHFCLSRKCFLNEKEIFIMILRAGGVSRKINISDSICSENPAGTGKSPEKGCET